MYRALASPRTHERMVAAPERDQSAFDGALAYWTPLIHLLVYGLGWARPDRGLQRWYEAGKPVDDPRLRLVSEVWGADGQLDWLAAFLWSSAWATDTHRLNELTGYAQDGAPVAVDREWLGQQRRLADDSGIPSPISSGSWDPFHLSGHHFGPLEERPPGGMLLCSDPKERRAVMTLDSSIGWYWALVTEGSRLPALGSRSWHVDVSARPVGRLGTYRRSRATGLRFMGQHSLHVQGV